MDFSNMLNDFVLTLTGDFVAGFIAATVILLISVASVLLLLRWANLIPRYEADPFEDDDYYVTDDSTVVFDGEKLRQHLKEKNR